MLLKLLNEYFQFSRKSRVAILILLSFILIVYSTLFILKNSYSPKEGKDYSILYAQMDSLMLSYHKEVKHVYHLESFDPNTVSLEKLIVMGFKPKNAKTLLKYRSFKTFYTAEDIGKLYFVNQDLLAQLKPFMIFPEREYKRNKRTSNYAKAPSSHFIKNKKERFTGTISINTADTTEWQKLHGIGAFLAKQIVRYRNKLGGFVQMEQLKEIKYLRPETFESIKEQLVLDPISIDKINLNSAQWKEIIRHPYFNKEQTNLICNYRRKFGEILSYQELLDNNLLTKEELQKVKPYCSL